MRDLELLYAFEQVDQRQEIVLEIHEGLFHGLSYRLVGSEMDDTRDVLIFLEYRKCVVVIAEIYFVVLDLFAGDLFYAFQYPGEERMLLSTQMTSNPFAIRSTIV